MASLACVTARSDAFRHITLLKADDRRAITRQSCSRARNRPARRLRGSGNDVDIFSSRFDGTTTARDIRFTRTLNSDRFAPRDPWSGLSVTWRNFNIFRVGVISRLSVPSLFSFFPFLRWYTHKVSRPSLTENPSRPIFQQTRKQKPWRGNVARLYARFSRVYILELNIITR